MKTEAGKEFCLKTDFTHGDHQAFPNSKSVRICSSPTVLQTY